MNKETVRSARALDVLPDSLLNIVKIRGRKHPSSIRVSFEKFLVPDSALKLLIFAGLHFALVDGPTLGGQRGCRSHRQLCRGLHGMRGINVCWRCALLEHVDRDKRDQHHRLG